MYLLCCGIFDWYIHSNQNWCYWLLNHKHADTCVRTHMLKHACMHAYLKSMESKLKREKQWEIGKESEHAQTSERSSEREWERKSRIHCNTLQHTAAHCNALQHTLQHTATHSQKHEQHHSAWVNCNNCNSQKQFIQMMVMELHMIGDLSRNGDTLEHTAPHTATRCNTLQHAAAYCNILQHATTHCNALWHTATHCNTLRHTATHCNTPSTTFVHDQQWVSMPPN